MSIYSDTAPTPHKLKSFFRQYEFPVMNVARFVGCSYQHALNILAGRSPAPEYIEKKLHELADRLRKEVDQK